MRATKTSEGSSDMWGKRRGGGEGNADGRRRGMAGEWRRDSHETDWKPRKEFEEPQTNKENDQQRKIGQTIMYPGDARWTSITFPGSEPMLSPIVHTNKECHTQDGPVEPKTAERDRDTCNHATE